MVGELRAQVHRGQVVELELRSIEARVRSVSVRLQARRVALARELASVQKRVDGLNGDMATVEQLVGDRYGIWFEGIVDGEIPVIGGVLQVCPVDMPHAYSDDFGAPRWAGGFHHHQGNDIFAPEGTPIRAPFDGTAVRAENTLGGLAVKVLGDGGYVYNAHLSAYGELGKVSVGTIIGYVGNTGDAVHSAPHNHFEWHPNGGDAVDPYPYLNAVCLPPSL
jgi:murein DD-endopeptidase MepM/ murein hydrolase activator NlpD